MASFALDLHRGECLSNQEKCKFIQLLSSIAVPDFCWKERNLDDRPLLKEVLIA